MQAIVGDLVVQPREAQARHLGGQGRVGIGQQFLVQLLARPEAGEHDGNLLLAVPRQPDQLACQLDDLHRLAHVQHQHLAAGADGTGLQHETRRLGDGHEVANDVRVRHGHRPALGDLLLELRDHAAAGAEHIAEAHGHEARARMRRGQRGDHHLGRALARAHHVGRVDGLVGADQHEALGALLARRQRGVVSAQRVVAQRRAGVVVLHQRHMLERGRVENDLRLPLRAHAAHVIQVLDIADQASER